MKKKNQAKKLSPPKKDKPAAARHSSGWLPKKPLKKLAAAIQGHGQTAASLKPEGVLLAPRACIERSLQNLPTGYGDNLIYLMARDPYWIYAYWEIQKEHEESVLVSLGADRSSVKSVLRVYDVTEPAGKTSFFDITLRDMLDHWFVNVIANRSYAIEIGLLHADGRFVALARSNCVTTPRDGMSEVLDEKWMGIDFEKLYALSGGFEPGKSSMELKGLMRERLTNAVTSGSGAGTAVSSGSSVKVAGKKRGFWFVLDCELIIYGATEPDAAVTMRGEEVKLRPDGTFSLRYALPDGKVELDAVATSADGVERRKIIPVVERNTERPDSIINKTTDDDLHYAAEGGGQP